MCRRQKGATENRGAEFTWGTIRGVRLSKTVADKSFNHIDPISPRNVTPSKSSKSCKVHEKMNMVAMSQSNTFLVGISNLVPCSKCSMDCERNTSQDLCFDKFLELLNMIKCILNIRYR